MITLQNYLPKALVSASTGTLQDKVTSGMMANSNQYLFQSQSISVNAVTYPINKHVYIYITGKNPQLPRNALAF